MKYHLVLILSLLLAAGCGQTESEETDLGNDGIQSTDTGRDAQSTTDMNEVADDGNDASIDDMGADMAADMAGTDAGDDADSAVPGLAAALIIEDQTLATPFDGLLITAANLPEESTQAGVIKVYQLGGAQEVLLGSHDINASEELTNVAMMLDSSLVGTQLCVARLLDGSDQAILGAGGEAVTAEFTLVGDMEEAELFVADQMMDGNDLYGLTISHVSVPARYTLGAWVAFYEDDAGSLGALRGKQRVMPGSYDDVAAATTTEIKTSQPLHAIMRLGTASGGWSSGGQIIHNLAGQVITSKFAVDSEVFRPILEVEDQDIFTTTTGTSQLNVNLVTVPEEYLGGAWVAIYADNAGVPGAFLGNLKYNRGTFADRTLSLDSPLSGSHTLHARLHWGQLWANAQNQVMQDSSGNEISVTFKTGAVELSYILSPPYTTSDPRHVVVQRAYSFAKPAWVLLARDNNGQPGTLLAKKRVMRRFAGNVHIHDLYGDFENSGNAVEYLTAQPGTYRRTVRGDENLHVMMHEDDPQDGVFTYTPGGTEDLPLLDSTSQPIVSRIDVKVVAAIQNIQKDSPRYYAPCSLSQFISNSTALPVDCRCHVDVTSLAFPECKAVIANYLGMEFGTGPRAYTHGFGNFRSGFSQTSASGDNLIALLVWKDAATRWPENDTTLDVGAVVQIDLTTRNRTVIGGRYVDAATGAIVDVGTGPVLSYPFEIQKGPDGMYYVGSYGYTRIGGSLIPTVDIIRMDPATGNREYVWRSNHLGFNVTNEVNPYGHCGNGRTAKFGYWSVQIGRKSFGIGPGGEFYLSYAHNGNTPTSDGIGILKIGATGDTCDFVTRSKVGVNNLLYQGQNVGGGVEPQAGPYKGMLVRNGKLYVSTALDDDLYEIDIATGDRTLIHADGAGGNDFNTGSSGTHVLWDSYRNLIWQAGLAGSTLMYDPTTGTTEPLWCPENDRNYKNIACMKIGAWGNNGLPMERGIWFHPTDPDYVFVPAGPMIQRAHLPSGTSEIFSY